MPVFPIRVSPKVRPALDPDFLPASLWNGCYRARVREGGKQVPLAIALEGTDGSVSVFRTAVLPHEGPNKPVNERYVERVLKFLLWQKGGFRVMISGDPEIAGFVRNTYSPEGKRAFDFHFMGDRVHGRRMIVEPVDFNRLPSENETTVTLGRHFEGCRIGFDLGASDMKLAAVADGKVVFTDEVAWDPSSQADPQYHFHGINDLLRRAARHLPRVDAIGGSAAGIYVGNEVRVASLFRGVPQDLFDRRVRRLFFDLKEAWGGIPFTVVNDGEVTALAGSMEFNDNAVLGIALGSSLAAGYVTPRGNITSWLNELAFVPVDYRADGPIDEWSGDEGVAVQYLSQQAVARLLPVAGIDLPDGMPPAARLLEVQKLMMAGDERAMLIYRTIGVYLGYALALFFDYYEVRNLLVLGRVMTGEGGEVILSMAGEVLKAEYPELAATIQMRTPDERERRHGQAVAAASLPILKEV